MKNKKRTQLVGTLQPFKKKQIIQVPVYYYQGGAWHKIEKLQKEFDRERKRAN